MNVPDETRILIPANLTELYMESVIINSVNLFTRDCFLCHFCFFILLFVRWLFLILALKNRLMFSSLFVGWFYWWWFYWCNECDQNVLVLLKLWPREQGKLLISFRPDYWFVVLFMRRADLFGSGFFRMDLVPCVLFYHFNAFQT